MTLPSLRDMVDVGSTSLAAARITLLDGETSHHAVMDEGPLMVSVTMLHQGQSGWVIYPGGSDDGTGCFDIPSLGTEVLVGFDAGEFEGNPYVVRTYGKTPDGMLDGENIVGAAVTVRLGSVAASESVIRGDEFRTDLNSLLDAIKTFTIGLNTYLQLCTGPTAPDKVTVAHVCTGLSTAVDTFEGLWGDMLSTKVKTE